MPWPRRKRKHESSSILRGGHLIDAAVLEKRLLFSATPIAPPVDHVDADPETQQPFPDGATAADATTHSGQGDPTQDDQQRQRRLEVAFVDASIGDYQPLVDALRSESGNADLEIYLLEGSRDGIEQIGEILSAYNHSAYNDIDAVHLLTDGADGQLRLGSSLVNAGNLDGSAGDFAAWGSSLSQDADLILHGFQSSQSPESRTMLEAISELTGAAVAVPTSDAVGAERVASDSNADVASADEHHTSREIVIVDQTAEDYQQLLADLQSERGDGRSFEVILLDGHSDGIDQISRALAQYDDVDAIHLVTHGTAGRLKLGDTWLSLDNLNDHADAIALWGDSLGDGADLLIYGCDLAANEDGRTLSTSLASLTGADVAASDDDTGHAILGGDWDLEYSTGAIETSLAFSLDVQQNWGHLLNVTLGNTAVFTTPSFAGSDSTSFDVGAGTDQLLLVSVSFGEDKGDEVSNITFNGVGLTKIGERQDADKARVEIWALVNPDTGTRTLNITYSGTTHQGAAVGVMSFNDVDQTTPLGVFASAKGDSSSQSVTVQAAPTDMVFGVLAYSDSNDYAFTAVTGTETWETFSGKTNATASTQSVSGTLSVNAQWSTSNNSTWAAAGIAIKSATVSGAPTISGLAGDTLSYNEDDSATVIEQGVDVIVTDGDSTDFDGGVLHVSITSGGDSGEDVLGIRDQGTGVGQIGVSGSNVTYNFGAGAVTIGTFSGGSGGNDLIVSLNSSANAEAAEALIENITYFNSDTANPSTSARNVRFQLYDGAGGVSGTHDTTVNVARINDAPTASNKTVSMDEDGVYTFSASDFNFSDVDIGDSLTQIKIKSLESVGTLKLSMFDVTDEQVISVGQIPNLTFTPVSQNHGNPYDSFTFQVFDGTEYSAATYTMTIDVDPKADTPTFNGPTNTDEDVLSTGFQLQRNAADGTEVTHFKISGVTNGTLYKNDGVTVISNNSFITFAEGNAGVKFKGTSNYNGAAGFSFQASATGNNSDLSATVSAGITIDPVNDAPVNSFPATQTTSMGVPIVFSAANGNSLAIADVDANSGELQITLNATAGTATLATTAGLSFVSGDGTGTVVIRGTIANLNNAMDGLIFTPTATGSGSLQLITDDQGNTGGPAETDDDTIAIAIGAAETHGLWLTTNGDVTGSGTTGLDDWSAAEIIQFGDPNLGFGDGTTSGTFSSIFDFDSLDVIGDGQVDIDAIDYVESAITVGGGANTFDLEAGDYLLSTRTDETLDAANQLVVTADDIFVYRQSNNTLYMLLDNLEGGTGNVNAVTLVGNTTTIGTSATSVTAGNFLITLGATDNQIHEYDPSGVGAGTTSGSSTLLVDGALLGITTADDIEGVELVEQTLTIGGTTLQAGYLLVTTDATATNVGTGNITVRDDDIFYLNLSGTGVATAGDAVHFFRGVDVDLTTNVEDPHGITLYKISVPSNSTPTFTSLDASPNFTEDGVAVVLDADVDIDDAELDAIGASGNYDGSSLTLVRNGGASADDVFGFNDGAGISLIGGNLIKNSQVIATFDTTTTAGQLVITFSDSGGEIPNSTDADNILRQITYANSSDTPPSSVQVDWLFDDGDASPQQANGNTTVNIAAANDAATLSNLNGDSFAYLPGSGALLIEQGNDATVADVDSADFDSGNLTVKVAAGFDASEDVLAIRNQGTNPGEISVSGSNVYYNFGAGAVLIGTWSGGSAGADLVVSLNAAADATATTALVRNITYENTDTVATNTGARTIRFTVNDGDGAVSLNHDATVTVVQGAPGGVIGGLTLWLRADAGVTIGVGGVSQWENQVANATLSDLQQGLSTQRPDLIASGLNFNPIISFDGINDHLSDLSVWGADLFGADSASIFLAGSTNGSSGVMMQWIDTLSNRVNLEDDIRFDFGDFTGDQLTTPTPSTGYHIINAQATPGAPAGLSINIDGRQTASGNASVGAPLDNTQFGQFFLGEYPGGGFNDDLDLGEIVIYSTDLSATDRLKVDSYLAIKYGLTLDQTTATNYLDSTGTIVWNAAANAGYDNDIAGIGQDNGSILSQGQSRSNNADSIVTMSAASNQDDREFLIWGNDNGTLGEVSGEPSGVGDRLARIWRVDETGDVGTTTITFDLTGLTYTGTTAADFNLIIDSDADFTSGASLVAAASYNAGTETVTFTGVNLADGNFFSLGTSLPPNAAPTINNLAGDTLNYTEGDAATVIEQGGNVTLSDGDSANFDTGNLTVSVFAGGDNTEDVLAIRDQGPGVGNITVSGSNVLYDFGGGPVVIGTFAGGSGGANLVVTFNASATPTAADALVENITYQNTDTTDPTTSARTIRFTINDGDGGTSVAHDATVNVSAQNDVPVIGNLAGDTLNYTEGDAATVIEQGGNVTLSDGDSADFDTGNLTVSVFAGGDNTEDVLAIRDQGAGVGNITVSLSNVLYDFGGGPVAIGTFAGGSGGANLVVTFNANATPTAADALIENITYQNTDTIAPTTSARTIRFTINDGDGGTSIAHDATVNVAAQNDVPVIGNLAGDTLNYTEGDAATVIEQGGNVTLTDGDSADFDTGNLTVSVFAGGDNAEDVLAIRDQGPGVGNITVSLSNVLYDFGAGPVVIGTFAGGSGGANLVVTFNANATATAADALIENVTYQNADTTDPTTSARTIRFTINDGDGGTSIAHDATVNVAPQNDAPTIGNLAGDTLNYTEGDAATVIEQGGNVTLSDGDSANFDTGNLTVSVFAGGDNAEDVLAIRDQGPGVGNITVSGGNVLYDFGAGPVVIGTFAGGSGGANLVVTFNANATATAADALIENITYQNTDTTNPTTSTRTIRFTLNDGDGGTSVAHDATVNVAASNGAPAIDLDTNDSSGASGADFAGTFTEGGPAVLIADAADAILTDVDSSNLTQLTVTIANLIDGASETLAADTSGTSITAVYAAGTLTLSGIDTVANYQQVLRTITYHNASSNPDGSTRVIQVVASDGGLNSNVARARIAITTVNDPPTAADDSFSMEAGKTLTIGVGGLLTNDVDLDGNSLTVIPVSGPISGTLTLAADGSFQFTPAANFSGPVTFTYAVTDGIATSVPTTVTILVAKPNDLTAVTPGDLESISSDPPPEPESVPEAPAEEDETPDETETIAEMTPVAEADVDVPPVLTRASVIQTTDDELLTLSMVPLSMPDLSDGDQDSERIARIDDGQNGYANRQSRPQSNRPNVSTLGIVKFDSKLLWGDMEGMQDDIKQSDAAPYYFAGTFAGFSGALSVGYVMWTVRGGLLATSLLAHLPAWSLVDPLLVLNELDDDDDGDDDSLEELLDKTEKEREQSTPTETASQSSASGETLT